MGKWRGEWVDPNQGCMKKPYGNPLIEKLIEKYNSERESELRYFVWGNNAAPRRRGLSNENLSAGLGILLYDLLGRGT